MSTDDTPRRTVLKRLGAVAVGTGTVFGFGYAGSRPAVAVGADDQLLADDVRIERNDGDLMAVTVAPELEVSWADFGGGIETIDVTLAASLEGVNGFDVLLETSVEDDSIDLDGDRMGRTDGTGTLRTDRRDLTATGSDVTTADFGGDLSPGESETTGVELTLRVDITGSQDETVTALETATFDVTVHNPEGNATTTGQANTDAE